MAPNSEHLESVFWSDAAIFVVEDNNMTLYGPFYNSFVAGTWAGDMDFRGWRVRTINPPAKPNRVHE